MKRPTIDELFREAEEARFREALLESTGEELLDRAERLNAQQVSERGFLGISMCQLLEHHPHSLASVRVGPANADQGAILRAAFQELDLHHCPSRNLRFPFYLPQSFAG
jgi:hypothetical protein